jgi:hypothetical protein
MTMTSPDWAQAGPMHATMATPASMSDRRCGPVAARGLVIVMKISPVEAVNAAIPNDDASRWISISGHARRPAVFSGWHMVQMDCRR